MKKILSWLLLGFIIITGLLLLVYVVNTNVIESKSPEASAPETTKFITVDNETYAYREINSNAPTTVIFVGGLSGWSGTWERVLQTLVEQSTDLNYIALDLPPFGYSRPAPDSDYRRGTQAKRVASFIDALGINKPILVGHSYGAGALTEYALNHPDRVEKLILIAPALGIGATTTPPTSGPLFISPVRTGAIGVLIHNDAFALGRLKSFVHITDHIDDRLLGIYTRYFDTTEVTARFSDWILDFVTDAPNYVSQDITAYEELPFPVHLIWGENDTLTPITQSSPLLQAIPDSTLHALPGIGHIPMIEDHERFMIALEASLKN